MHGITILTQPEILLDRPLLPFALAMKYRPEDGSVSNQFHFIFGSLSALKILT